MPQKIDLKKKYKHLYVPSAKKAVIIDVPAFNFVMLDGVNQPAEMPGTSESYRHAIEALYGASYTLKFMSKLRKQHPIDYTVMALDEFDFRKARHDPFLQEVLSGGRIMILGDEDALVERKTER